MSFGRPCPCVTWITRLLWTVITFMDGSYSVSVVLFIRIPLLWVGLDVVWSWMTNMDKLNLIQPSINSIFLFLVEGWSFFYWMFSISFHIVTISCVSIYYGFFFFFLESFNLWRPLLIIALYYQVKTPIGFWCRQGLNPRSFI